MRLSNLGVDGPDLMWYFCAMDITPRTAALAVLVPLAAALAGALWLWVVVERRKQS